mmetsp:Transcript_114395/g.286028  ORF Transcript_114395/g.286028 Transcript_114395/m.286028 type:complete len:274 (+) Transcript_114395:753-1574(+)
MSRRSQSRSVSVVMSRAPLYKSESQLNSAFSQRASKSANAPPLPATSSNAARLSGVPRTSKAATTCWKARCASSASAPPFLSGWKRKARRLYARLMSDCEQFWCSSSVSYGRTAPPSSSSARAARRRNSASCAAAAAAAAAESAAASPSAAVSTTSATASTTISAAAPSAGADPSSLRKFSTASSEARTTRWRARIRASSSNLRPSSSDSGDGGGGPGGGDPAAFHGHLVLAALSRSLRAWRCASSSAAVGQRALPGRSWSGPSGDETWSSSP